MALYVCRRRTAGLAVGLGASRCDRTCALEAERNGRPDVADLAAVRDAFFEWHAPQNDSEFPVHAGFHLRPLGGNGVRPCRGDGACGSGGGGRGPLPPPPLPGGPAWFFFHNFLCPWRAPAPRK